jgi:hypothetical protein
MINNLKQSIAGYAKENQSPFVCFADDPLNTTSAINEKAY